MVRLNASTAPRAKAVSNATDRFADRVDDYVRYRPTYPRALRDWLVEHAYLRHGDTAADIGAGTGISSALFLDLGCEVFAVEPNAPMRDAAIARLGTSTHFHAVAGRAEATTLPDASVDLISVAQAFHWFDETAVRKEWRRVLRSNGRVAIYWNSRRLDGSPFLIGYEKLLREFGTDYADVAERYHDDDAMRRWFGDGLRDVAVFAHRQRLDFDGLRGRLLSSSYAPKSEHPRYADMIAALRELFDATAHEGHVDFDYRTRLFAGVLA